MLLISILGLGMYWCNTLCSFFRHLNCLHHSANSHVFVYCSVVYLRPSACNTHVSFASFFSMGFSLSPFAVDDSILLVFYARVIDYPALKFKQQALCSPIFLNTIILQIHHQWVATCCCYFHPLWSFRYSQQVRQF